MREPPKPIETVYRGYRFRSRLEARWAVFFDTLRIPFEYEKEGYHLGDGLRYLPDFWLPEQNCWIEIKGRDVDTGEPDWEKCRRLAIVTSKRVYLFFGQISPPAGDWKDEADRNGYVFYPLGDPEWVETLDADYRPTDDPDDPDRWWFASWWCQCPSGHLGIAFAGRSELLICGHTSDLEAFATPDLQRAYARARGARFEFGESG